MKICKRFGFVLILVGLLDTIGQTSLGQCPQPQPYTQCPIPEPITCPAGVTGDFCDAEGPYVSPAGLGAVLNGSQVQVDQTCDGIPDAAYDLPNSSANDPGQILASCPSCDVELRLSPSQDTLFMKISRSAGSVPGCPGGEVRVYFYRVGTPPTLIPFNGTHQGECMNGVAIGPVFHDQPGNPIRTGVVVAMPDFVGAQQAVLWADMVNGALSRDDFNYLDEIQWPQFSQQGNAAFIRSVNGGAPTRYGIVDLCQSRTGGAVTTGSLPPGTTMITGAGVSGSTGSFAAVISHNGTGGQITVPLADCLCGACCDGLTCTDDTSVTDCSLFSLPFYPGGACSADPCLQAPPEACCLADGICQDLDSMVCLGQGGTPAGYGTTCATADCQVPGTHTLTVQIVGPGNGAVLLDPPGLWCGTDCQETYPPGTPVDLTASPDLDSVFLGWSGDCLGIDPSAQVTMDGNRICIATFDRASADVFLIMTDSPDPVIAGQSLAYTITVTNDGPYGATQTEVLGTLPNGTTFDPISSSPECSVWAGDFFCYVGDLGSSASTVLTLAVTVDPAARGSIVNTAEARAIEFDPDLSDNLAVASTTVQAIADLSLAKSDTPDPATAGGVLIYELAVTNLGPSTATGVTVTDTLPPGVTRLDGQGDPTTGTQIMCDAVAINPGESRVFTVIVQVDSAVPAGTILTNTGTVSANENDTNTANNIAIEHTTVAADPGASPQAFRKIASTTMPVPGGSGNFTNFTAPANSAGFVGFYAQGSNGWGVYRSVLGQFASVANLTSPAPGGPGDFTGFGLADTLSMSGLNIAFTGVTGAGFDSATGIYYTDLCGLQVAANRYTQHPNPNAVFQEGVSSPRFRGGKMVFHSSGVAPGVLYLWNGLSFTTIVDRDTPIPQGSGNFNDLGGFGYDGTDVVFWGGGGELVDGRREQMGIYASSGGSLVRVADKTTPIPGKTESFVGFAGNPSIDAGRVVFTGVDSSLKSGIYLYDLAGGSLSVAVDDNTLIPGTAVNFGLLGETYGPPSISGGKAAFIGAGPAYEHFGIYLLADGVIRPLVLAGDEIDGKQVGALQIAQEALSGDYLSFLAMLQSSGSPPALEMAVYVAHLPSLLGVAADLDGDGDVDNADHDLFNMCATGPGIPQPDSQCAGARLDADEDVDQSDFSIFQRCFSGEGVPADPDCGG